MARSTKPRYVKTTPKPINGTASIPVISNPAGGLSIAALEKMWRKPIPTIRQWVADGHLTQRDDHFFDRAEVERFNRERSDLLA